MKLSCQKHVLAALALVVTTKATPEYFQDFAPWHREYMLPYAMKQCQPGPKPGTYAWYECDADGSGVWRKLYNDRECKNAWSDEEYVSWRHEFTNDDNTDPLDKIARKWNCNANNDDQEEIITLQLHCDSDTPVDAHIISGQWTEEHFLNRMNPLRFKVSCDGQQCSTNTKCKRNENQQLCQLVQDIDELGTCQQWLTRPRGRHVHAKLLSCSVDGEPTCPNGDSGDNSNGQGKPSDINFVIDNLPGSDGQTVPYLIDQCQYDPLNNQWNVYECSNNGQQAKVTKTTYGTDEACMSRTNNNNAILAQNDVDSHFNCNGNSNKEIQNSIEISIGISCDNQQSIYVASSICTPTNDINSHWMQCNNECGVDYISFGDNHCKDKFQSGIDRDFMPQRILTNVDCNEWYMTADSQAIYAQVSSCVDEQIQEQDCWNVPETDAPSVKPTSTPTAKPTSTPTTEPTAAPTARPGYNYIYSTISFSNSQAYNARLAATGFCQAIDYEAGIWATFVCDEDQGGMWVNYFNDADCSSANSAGSLLTTDDAVSFECSYSNTGQYSSSISIDCSDDANSHYAALIVDNNNENPNFSDIVDAACETNPDDGNSPFISDYFVDTLELGENGESVLVPFAMEYCHATSDSNVFRKYSCDADTGGVWIEEYHSNGGCIETNTSTNTSNVNRELTVSDGKGPKFDQYYYNCNFYTNSDDVYAYDTTCQDGSNELNYAYIILNIPGFRFGSQTIPEYLESACEPDTGNAKYHSDYIIDNVQFSEDYSQLAPYAMNYCQGSYDGSTYTKYSCDADTNGVWIETYTSEAGCIAANTSTNTSNIERQLITPADRDGRAVNDQYFYVCEDTTQDDIFSFDLSCGEQENEATHTIHILEKVPAFNKVEEQLEEACEPDTGNAIFYSDYIIDYVELSNGNSNLAPYAIGFCHGSSDGESFRKYTCDVDTNGVWIEIYDSNAGCIVSNTSTNTSNIERVLITPEDRINQAVNSQYYFACNNVIQDDIFEFDLSCGDTDTEQSNIAYIVKKTPAFNKMEDRLDETCEPDIGNEIFYSDYIIDYIEVGNDQWELAPFAIGYCHGNADGNSFTKYTCDIDTNGVWIEVYNTPSGCISTNSSSNTSTVDRELITPADRKNQAVNSQYYFACNGVSQNDIFEFDTSCGETENENSHIAYIIEKAPAFNKMDEKLHEACEPETGNEIFYSDYIIDYVELSNGNIELAPYAVGYCHANADGETHTQYTCDADTNGIWIEVFSSAAGCIPANSSTNTSNVERSLITPHDKANAVNDQYYYQCNNVAQDDITPFDISCGEKDDSFIYVLEKAPAFNKVPERLQQNCAPGTGNAIFFSDYIIDFVDFGNGNIELAPYAIGYCQGSTDGQTYTQYTCDADTNGVWIETYNTEAGCIASNTSTNTSNVERTLITPNDKPNSANDQYYYQCNGVDQDDIASFDISCGESQDDSSIIYVIEKAPAFNKVPEQLEEACEPGTGNAIFFSDYIIDYVDFGNGIIDLTPYAIGYCQGSANGRYYTQYTCDSDTNGVWIEMYDTEAGCIAANSSTNTSNVERTLILPEDKPNAVNDQYYFQCNDVAQADIVDFDTSCGESENALIYIVEKVPGFNKPDERLENGCEPGTGNAIFFSDYIIDYIDFGNGNIELAPFAIGYCHGSVNGQTYTQYSCDGDTSGVWIETYNTDQGCIAANTSTNTSNVERILITSDDKPNAANDQYYYQCNDITQNDIFDFDLSCGESQNPAGNTAYIVEKAPAFNKIEEQLQDACEPQTGNAVFISDYIIDYIELGNGASELAPYAIGYCHGSADGSSFRQYTCDVDTDGVWIETFTSTSGCIAVNVSTNTSNVERMLIIPSERDTSAVNAQYYYSCNDFREEDIIDFDSSCNGNPENSANTVYIVEKVPAFNKIADELEDACFEADTGNEVFQYNDYFIDQIELINGETALAPLATGYCQTISTSTIHRYECEQETGGIWVEQYVSIESCLAANFGGPNVTGNATISRRIVMPSEYEGEQDYFECNSNTNERIIQFDIDCDNRNDGSSQIAYISRGAPTFSSINGDLNSMCSGNAVFVSDYYVAPVAINDQSTNIPLAINYCQATGNGNSFTRYECDHETGGIWVEQYNHELGCVPANTTDASGNNATIFSRNLQLPQKGVPPHEAGYYQCNDKTLDDIFTFNAQCNEDSSIQGELIRAVSTAPTFRNIEANLEAICDGEEPEEPKPTGNHQSDESINYFIDVVYAGKNGKGKKSTQILAAYATDLCQSGPFDGIYVKYECDADGAGMWRSLYLDSHCQIPFYSNETNEYNNSEYEAAAQKIAARFEDGDVPSYRQLYTLSRKRPRQGAGRLAPQGAGTGQYDFSCSGIGAIKATKGQIIEMSTECSEKTNARFYVVSDICVSATFEGKQTSSQISANDNDCGSFATVWKSSKTCSMQQSDAIRTAIGNDCVDALGYGKIRSDSCINPRAIILEDSNYEQLEDDHSWWSTLWNNFAGFFAQLWKLMSQHFRE